MFYMLVDVVEFSKLEDLLKIMQFVVEFLFDKGILGEGVLSLEFVGVLFFDGLIYGDVNNVKLWFDLSIMEMVVSGVF